MLNRLEDLQQKLQLVIQTDYPITSRVHRLNSYSNCYVKRDDELGFGISGSKVRKYRTLLPYLCSLPYKEIIVIGGAYSNHILGVVQLLIENGLKPFLFLKGSAPPKLAGNYFFLEKLLLPSQITWIPKNLWSDVNKLANDYGRERMFVLPEGAPLFESFLGALSLPLDIMRNQKELSLQFEHIFLDVGTGLSAAATLIGFAFLEIKAHFHLLLTAGTEQDFLNTLHSFHNSFEKWLGQSCPFPAYFTCFKPTIAPSFGSTNAKIFNFIREFAQKEGFFLDPIYSAKLFYEAGDRMRQMRIEENVLILHSGGALTLTGFEF